MDIFFLVIGLLFSFAAVTFSHNKIKTIDFIVLVFLIITAQTLIESGLKNLLQP
jgi:hypothetical protein